MSRIAHHQAKESGFHDYQETEIGFAARNCSNLHGEVSELWETHRRKVATTPCDKTDRMLELQLPVLTCEEEEIADIVIRVLDYAEARKIDLGRVVAIKHTFNGTRTYRHGDKAA